MSTNPSQNPEYPFFAPDDLQQARADRLAALQAVADDPNASHQRRETAKSEIQQINETGYHWPANTGYPVAAPIYTDADQNPDTAA